MSDANCALLRPKMNELVILMQAKVDASLALNEALKEAAEECDVKPNILRKIVKAKLDEALKETSEESEEIVAIIKQIDGMSD